MFYQFSEIVNALSKKGGKAHTDEAEGRVLIKKEIKKAMGKKNGCKC